MVVDGYETGEIRVPDEKYQTIEYGTVRLSLSVAQLLFIK